MNQQSTFKPVAITLMLMLKAEQLNQRGAELFGKTDQALDAASSYFNAIRPTKSER